MIKLSDVRLNESNPRYIKDDQFEKLVKSIRDFPRMLELRPIVIDGDGVIVGGNMRYRALLEIGYGEVDDSWVKQAADFTPEELREFVIKDNLPFGDWDWEELANSWDVEELSGWGLEIPDLAGDDVGEGQEEDEQELEKLLDEVGKIESRVKLGEIWQLGRHKICCGDSTIESNVRALLGDAEIVLVHADPPYGMGKEKDGVINDNLYRDKLDVFQMQWIKACRKSITDNGSFYIWGNAEDLWRLWYSGGLKNSERLTFRNQVVWDKKYGQGMLAEEFRMYPTATEHCLFFMLGEQSYGEVFWDGWKPIRDYMIENKEKAKLKTCKQINMILEVDDSGGGMASHYFSNDGKQWMLPTEDMYKKLQSYCQQNGIDAFKKEYEELKKEYYATRAYFNNTHEKMTDVWEYPRVHGEERWGHATPKPVDMISRIYKSSSPDGGAIYSPFLGSGTDIIAAQKMEGDRTVYGFELSPDYCTVILSRWENFTGLTAQLIGNL